MVSASDAPPGWYQSDKPTTPNGCCPLLFRPSTRLLRGLPGATRSTSKNRRLRWRPPTRHPRWPHAAKTHCQQKQTNKQTAKKHRSAIHVGRFGSRRDKFKKIQDPERSQFFVFGRHTFLVRNRKSPCFVQQAYSPNGLYNHHKTIVQIGNVAHMITPPRNTRGPTIVVNLFSLPRKVPNVKSKTRRSRNPRPPCDRCLFFNSLQAPRLQFQSPWFNKPRGPRDQCMF